MANNLGSAILIPHLAAGLAAIRTEHLALSRWGRNLAVPGQQFGSTVMVKTAKVGTATAWDGKTDLVASDVDVEEIPVVINKRVKWGISLTAADLAIYGEGLNLQFARILVVPLVDAIMKDAAGLVTKANVPNETVEALVDVDAHTFARLATPLNTRKAAPRDRFAIISSLAAETLKGDPTVVRVNESGTSQTLREGLIGRLHGFDVAEYTEVPDTENLLGFAGSPDGIVFAGRPVDTNSPFAEIPNPTYTAVVTDPITGLSITLFGASSMTIPGKQSLFAIAEYGVAIGRAASLERLVKAANA